MEQWNDLLLGDALTLQRGFDLAERERVPGQVPIVSSSGVTGYHNTSKVKGPGVVTGRYGTLGEVFYIDEDFWPLNTTLWVKDFKGNDPRFLSFLLRTLNLAKRNAAGAVPGINRNALHLLPIRMPAPRTQRQIAQILSAYDDLIENNTRRIKILEEMAQMLYREWFVHFRFPGHEKVRMVESELGPIPEGWSVGRLDDAVTLQRGFDLPTAQRVPGIVPIIAATGTNGFHNESKVTGPGVVTGRSGSLGTVVFVAEDFWPLNTTLWVKQFKRSTPTHAYFLLKSLDFQTFNSGAAVPTLNRNDVHGLRTILPLQNVLDDFNAHALSFFALKRSLELKNKNLRTTRDLLLPKLISGEIPVEAAENGATAIEEEVALHA